jgi:hypothetical protein
LPSGFASKSFAGANPVTVQKNGKAKAKTSAGKDIDLMPLASIQSPPMPYTFREECMKESDSQGTDSPSATPLGRSERVRFELGGPDNAMAFEISVSGPWTFDPGPSITLKEQIVQDGFSMAALATAIRRWALTEPDVERVTLGHTGARYVLAVLLDKAEPSRVADVESRLGSIRERFGERALSTYVFGPEYRESAMFEGSDRYVVCARTPQRGANAR